MASKHDAKRARENMWVTHQNLARAKGGHPGYQFKERKLPFKPVVVVVASPAPAAPPVDETKPVDTSSSGS